MKNELENCTHPLPPNRFGIFATHCRDNQPLSPQDHLRIIEGPIAVAQPILEEELSHPVDERVVPE